MLNQCRQVQCLPKQNKTPAVNKTHSSLQKGQEGGPRELQAGQPHLHPKKGDGAAYPGGHHQASGRKEGYQE